MSHLIIADVDNLLVFLLLEVKQQLQVIHLLLVCRHASRQAPWYMVQCK